MQPRGWRRLHRRRRLQGRRRLVARRRLHGRVRVGSSDPDPRVAEVALKAGVLLPQYAGRIRNVDQVVVAGCHRFLGIGVEVDPLPRKHAVVRVFPSGGDPHAADVVITVRVVLYGRVTGHLDDIGVEQAEVGLAPQCKDIPVLRVILAQLEIGHIRVLPAPRFPFELCCHRITPAECTHFEPS